MVCPSCQRSTRVLDSRPADSGAAVRRRRHCPACGHRFTTYERREREPLFVRKRGGEREHFDRLKLRSGMLRAAHKRPVGEVEIDALIDAIEREAEEAGGELAVETIGERCLEGLRDLDRVAYLQFASVYKGFSDPDQFTEELRRLGVEPQRRSAAESTQFASSPGGGSV